MKKITSDILKTTGTNIIYAIGGTGMILYSPALIAPGIFGYLLCIGSGIHHFFDLSRTRKYDFIAMYLQFASLFLAGLGAGLWLNIILSIVSAGLLYAIFRNSILPVAGLVAGCLALVFLHSNIFSAMEILAWGALAMNNNILGDNAPDPFHPTRHGIGWHIPTGYMIILIAQYIIA